MKRFLTFVLLLTLLLVSVPVTASAAPKYGTVYDAVEIFGKGSDYFKFGYFNGDKPGNPPEDKMAEQGNGKIGTSHFKFYSWTAYSLHTGIHIVRVDSLNGGANQNSQGFSKGDIIMMVTWSPYVAFVAPCDGAYQVEIGARRAFEVAEGNDGCNIVIKSSRGNTYFSKTVNDKSDVNYNKELFLKKGDRVYLTVDPLENNSDDEIVMKKFKVTFKSEVKASSTVYNVKTNFGTNKYKNFTFGTRDNATGKITSAMTWYTGQVDDGTGAAVNGYSTAEAYSGGNAVNIITDGSDKGKLTWKPLDTATDKVVVFTAPAAGYYYVEFSPARMWAVSGDRDASEYYVIKDGVKIDNYRTYSADTINYVFPMVLAKNEKVVFGVHCISNSAADNSWLNLKLTLYKTVAEPVVTTTTQAPETTPEETTTEEIITSGDTTSDDTTTTQSNPNNPDKTTKPSDHNPETTNENKNDNDKKQNVLPFVLIGLAVVVVVGAVVAVLLVDKKK